MTAHGQNGQRVTTPPLFKAKGNAMVSAELLAAYRRTQYQADTPLGSLSLRIGEPNPLLDQLLIQHHAQHWAYISACNPGSIVLSPAENQQRHCALQTCLATQGYLWYSGFGYPDPEHDSHWVAEASVLILDIAPHAAHTLAQQFGQSALVSGRRGGVPELVVCHHSPSRLTML